MKRLIIENVPIAEMSDGNTYILACIPLAGRTPEVGGVPVVGNFRPARLVFVDDETGDKSIVEMEPTE